MKSILKQSIAFSALAMSILALPGAVHAKEYSTISGQPVPVGSRNLYEYDYKRLNISTNPISMMFGTYGVALSYAVGSQVALRADAEYIDLLDSNVEGFGLRLSAPIYFRKVYSGFYIEPGVRSFTLEGTEGVGPTVLLGWHWMWDSGLNIALAAGLGRTWVEDGGDNLGDYYDDAILPDGYLRFGWAF